MILSYFGLWFGNKGQTRHPLKNPSQLQVFMGFSLMSFQELFYSKLTVLWIIHFPTLKFYQDLQHKAALLMKEMNQLPLFLFFPWWKSHSALFVLKLDFEKRPAPIANKRRFQGSSISQVISPCRNHCCLSHAFYPKTILPGFQVPPPLKSLPESSSLHMTLTSQNIEHLFYSFW